MSYFGQWVLRHIERFTTQASVIQPPATLFTNGNANLTYTSVDSNSGYLAFNSGTTSTRDAGYIYQRPTKDLRIVTNIRLGTLCMTDINFRFVFRTSDNTPRGYALNVNIGSVGNILLLDKAVSTISTVNSEILVDTNYEFEILCIGSNIKVYKNNSLILDVNNSLYSVGYSQIYFQSSDLSNNRLARLNSFEIYDKLG